jgi:crotonobetainyl-CoA:carnitine CoA-transferase CaiB-like acyl-CoA transferase
MSADEALTFLSGLDVCFGRVNTLLEALKDENIQARGMILRDDAGRRHIAPVIRFRDEPSESKLDAPLLGAHTDEIVERVRRSGVAPAGRSSARQ